MKKQNIRTMRKFTKSEINVINSIDDSREIGKEIKRISKELGRSVGSVSFKYYQMRRKNARKVYIPKQKTQPQSTTYNFKNVKSVDIDGNSVRIIV